MIGRPELIAELDIADAARRSLTIDRLYSLIDEVAPERTTQRWLDDLRALDIPCAPVNSLSDLLQDDHLEAVRMFSVETHPTEGRIRTVRSPLQVSGLEPCADLPAPRLGDDGAAILAELRFDPLEIASLVAAGVVGTGSGRNVEVAQLG